MNRARVGSVRLGLRFSSVFSLFVFSLEDQMPYVRGHVRREGFLGRRTWVRSYYRRNPRRRSSAYALVAAAVFLLLLWLIFAH
jgi:hypothetical protein